MNLLKSFMRAGVFLTVLMLLVIGTTHAEIDKTVRHYFDVSPGGYLILDTEMGSIDVQTGSSDKVEVEIYMEARTNRVSEAEEYFDNFRVDVEEVDDRVEIICTYEGDYIRRHGGRTNPISPSFYVTVPEKFDLKLVTSAGSIHVGDLEGKIDVKTSGGSLSFENIKGPIDGHTSGGSITIIRCDDDVDVHTSGGSISIGQAKGNIRAKTSGGSINIDEVYGYIDASTSGGSVTAHLAEQPRDDCRLSTSGGSVTVYLAEGIGVDLDAKTSSSGRVKSDMRLQIKNGRVKRNIMAGRLNGGGPELYLRTSGGNIYIREI